MAKTNVSGVGLTGVVLAMILTGCAADHGGKTPIATKPVITPVPIAFATKSKLGMDDVAIAGTEAPSAPMPEKHIDGAQRLVMLQATARPVLPSKSSAYSGLSDGPLIAAEIKALFMDLKIRILAQGENRRTHHFARDGYVEGWIYDTTIHHQADGMGFSDWGTWTVTRSSRLCMDWFDWYLGESHCYDVSKSGDEIVLRREDATIRYAILN